MDTNLETKLTSYNFLLVILFIFLIIVIVIYKVNSNAFSYSFGKEIFVTLPFLFIIIFLIKEILVFKMSPTDSFLSNYSFSNNPIFIPVLISLTLATALGGFFSVLAVAGIFDDKPPANNSSIILNIALIFLFIIVSSILFFYSQQKDQPILNQIPIQIRYIYELRTKWTIAFVAFVAIVFLLYLVNPGGAMTEYGGPVIFFSLFVGLVMFSMIYIYQYFLDNPSKSNMFSSAPTFVSFLLKGSYIIGALTLSGLMIYGVLKVMGILDGSGSNYNSWPHYLINFILIGTLIGILYKLFTAGGYFTRSPFFRLIINTLLYIPCILVYFISLLSNLLGLSSDTSSGFSPATPSEKRILIIALVLVVGYFLSEYVIIPYISKKIVTQGGKQYINEPITLTSIYNVASYQELNGLTDPDTHNYQYALSFWFYIDSFPPSTNSSYLKNVQILSFGDNPCIYYDSSLNTLSISVKQSSEPIYSYINEETGLSINDIKKWKEVKLTLDDNKNSHNVEIKKEQEKEDEIENPDKRILYKNANVFLQKWNNIVLNYNGGTLDIFYNGELVKSSIEVVPYLSYDMLTIGSDNGISGNIANLVYFKNTVDAVTISNIYNTLKNKNPPIL
jgi:hypothetical protein